MTQNGLIQTPLLISIYNQMVIVRSVLSWNWIVSLKIYFFLTTLIRILTGGR